MILRKSYEVIKKWSPNTPKNCLLNIKCETGETDEPKPIPSCTERA